MFAHTRGNRKKEKMVKVDLKCLVCGKMWKVIVSNKWKGWRFSGLSNLPKHKHKRSDVSL
jgi:hypothetical protein